MHPSIWGQPIDAFSLRLTQSIIRLTLKVTTICPTPACEFQDFGVLGQMWFRTLELQFSLSYQARPRSRPILHCPVVRNTLESKVKQWPVLAIVLDKSLNFEAIPSGSKYFLNFFQEV